ncbi:N-acetylneuraminate synthase [Clostridium formicaceticum]|uniref:N,N'-diacetyllegionaminic acid synthase n=1 Tax=Clostridium formicaceticum TaxID=1497 RepID=A0AAC9RIY5_9CLOT|nr:N-acetylneuraminate synthase [Clostridium formicaceticum]AOY75658.1 N-acetylneuraminate synthase [Clostridium formicaceticum]ARE85973.1 N,N'-diacetyllegionaminic acid synthase [Clostridium formicaceticum]
MGCFIIAEAGVNHNGDLKLAKKLVDIAVEAKCDAVKFQTFKAELGLTKSARKAAYQVENTGQDGTQYEMVKKLELNETDHIELISYCKGKKILFLSTPFDKESVDLLHRLDVAMFKVASGEITNKPLLKYIAKKEKPIILSTGMSTLGEVEEALEWIYQENNRQVTLLHCTSSYPTQMIDVNLKAMETLKNAFQVDVGYSDHTLGIEIPTAAVALGAKIIEKHITLNKEMEGPDHKASLEPHELKQMVAAIRNVEAALGNGIKKVADGEKDTLIVARKSIVAKRRIKQGEVVTEEMLCVKRPGNGISPKNIGQVVGLKAKANIEEDTLITLKDFW